MLQLIAFISEISYVKKVTDKYLILTPIDDKIYMQEKQSDCTMPQIQISLPSGCYPVRLLFIQ